MFEFCKRNIIWISLVVVVLNMLFCLVNGFNMRYVDGLIIASLFSIGDCFLNFRIVHNKYVDNMTLFVLYGALLISIIFVFYNIIPISVKTESTLDYVCFSPIFVINFLVYKKLDIKKKLRDEHNQ